jgi:rhodanese-related sulfurtransferase
MIRRLTLFLLVLGFIGPSAVASAAVDKSKEFPYRSQYIDVTVVELDELHKRFKDVVIVDVRSEYEYETLHIKGAINIPLDRKFVDKVRELRLKTDKPIVFYCNGKTCRKSYDAVLKTLSARIPDCQAYDAGVFDWAKAYPDLTVLVGKSPMKPGDLLSSEDFKSRLLAPKEFAAQIDGRVIVLDVRDRVQRDSPLFPFKESRAQLDETAKIDQAIDQAKREKKTLLIYDAVGKQVQWMQYHLEAKGLKDYYFMKGGAQAYWDATLGKVSLGDKKDEGKK